MGLHESRRRVTIFLAFVRWFPRNSAHLEAWELRRVVVVVVVVVRKSTASGIFMVQEIYTTTKRRMEFMVKQASDILQLVSTKNLARRRLVVGPAAVAR